MKGSEKEWGEKSLKKGGKGEGMRKAFFRSRRVMVQAPTTRRGGAPDPEHARKYVHDNRRPRGEVVSGEAKDGRTGQGKTPSRVKRIFRRAGAASRAPLRGANLEDSRNSRQSLDRSGRRIRGEGQGRGNRGEGGVGGGGKVINWPEIASKKQALGSSTKVILAEKRRGFARTS